MSYKGSGGNSSRSEWQWDPTRRQHYYVDHRTQEYVFRDGSRIPIAQSTPRSPVPPPAAVPSRSSGDHFSAGSQRSNEYQVTGQREPPQQPPQQPFEPQPRSYFRKFRMFAVQAQDLPASSGVSVLSSLRPLSPADYGTITGVQRYVIISVPEGQSFVWALPIASYGRQGVGREGVIKEEHGIIHTDKNPPGPAPGEWPRRGENPMLPDAIRVRPNRPDEPLHPMSRINYGLPTQIHMSTPVRDLGIVHHRSEAALIYQHEYVQKEQAKRRQQRSAVESSQRQASSSLDTQAVQTQNAYRMLQQKGWTEQEILQRLIVTYQSSNPGLTFDAARDIVMRLLAHKPRDEL